MINCTTFKCKNEEKLVSNDWKKKWTIHIGKIENDASQVVLGADQTKLYSCEESSNIKFPCFSMFLKKC